MTIKEVIIVLISWRGQYQLVSHLFTDRISDQVLGAKANICDHIQ